MPSGAPSSGYDCRYRRTRSGRVLRVVGERYLRDDLGFGTLPGQGTLADEAQLLSVLSDEHKVEGVRQLLVLDTNVVLHQIDLLEQRCPALCNVIVPETVLIETKANSLSVYNRLVVLLRDDSRCFVAYANEHCRDTFVRKLPKESTNDRNDRAIRRTARWYADRLEPEGLARVLLLTNDRACRELAKEEGLQALRVQVSHATSLPRRAASLTPGGLCSLTPTAL